MERVQEIPEAILPCPFCKGAAHIFKEELWRGDHGYIGCYTYWVGCRNDNCLIKPKTRDFDDVYGPADRAIHKAVRHWNSRKERK